MRRRILILAAGLLMSLGMTAGPAMASSQSAVTRTAPAAAPPPTTPGGPAPLPAPTAGTPAPAPATPAGYAVWCDHGSSQYCLNDSGSKCTTGTWVVGWNDTDVANMWVYTISQGGGWYSIHFASCGNSWCVWKYTNQNNVATGQLSLAPCNSANGNDLWQFPSDGYSSLISNKIWQNYATCWNTIGQQCQSLNSYVYGNSDWNTYTN